MTENSDIQSQVEQILIRRIRSGDNSAVREWFSMYHDRLLSFVSLKIPGHFDAEELVQEVFVNSLRQMNLFKGNSSLWTWMVSIARHEIADYYRKKYAKHALRSLPLSYVFEELKTSSNSAISDRQESVHSVLSCLSQLQQELLRLKYIDGKSVTEIAQSIGRTVKSVESELYRARVAFREQWEVAAAAE